MSELAVSDIKDLISLRKDYLSEDEIDHLIEYLEQIKTESGD